MSSVTDNTIHIDINNIANHVISSFFCAKILPILLYSKVIPDL